MAELFMDSRWDELVFIYCWETPQLHVLWDFEAIIAHILASPAIYTMHVTRTVSQPPAFERIYASCCESANINTVAPTL